MADVLVVAVFDDEKAGWDAVVTAAQLGAQHLGELHDACLVVRDDDGKVCEPELQIRIATIQIKRSPAITRVKHRALVSARGEVLEKRALGHPPEPLTQYVVDLSGEAAAVHVDQAQATGAGTKFTDQVWSGFTVKIASPMPGAPGRSRK